MRASQPEDRGFHFPGVFQIVVMGAAEAGLDLLVPRVLATCGIKQCPDAPLVRSSRQGKYVSITISFEAATREDFDAVHAALRAHPEVKWTL